ncbi:31826_t:CDS:2, partial [Gigaspora margarita]
MVLIEYSVEWTHRHKSGVRIKKVRLDLLTGSSDADSHEMGRSMYDCHYEYYDNED